MKRWFLPLIVLVIPLAVFVVNRAQASGQPVIPLALDTVVLTGSYSCVITEYTQAIPVPVGDPVPEPVIVHDFSHAISINGTGGVTANNPSVPGARPGLGPGIGGRFVGSSITPVNLGSGIGASFDEGTEEDCVRFAEAIRSIASRLGCETSQVYSRGQAALYVLADVRFSFVCEGRSADQVHTIGEMDRSLLSQRPASAN